MSYFQRISALLVLVAAVALAAGCGGSGDGDASSAAETIPASVTKQAFISEADAICKAADAAQEVALGAFIKKHPVAEKTPSKAGMVLVEVGLPPVATEAEELGELTPPQGDEAAYEKSTASGAVTPFAAVGKEAAAYGFEACATPL